MKLIRNYLTALVLAVLGVYVLRQWHDVYGLGVGTVAILLALQIALATEFDSGLQKFKANIVLIVPTVFDALKGGARKTDPPAGGAE